MNIIKTCFLAIAILVFINSNHAQSAVKPDKVSHAEPLYFDLVRDLGARKGEKEWNIGTGYSKFTHYNEHAFLVEYEFAPVNRLGFEVEADFSFFRRTGHDVEIPNNRMECLRFSTQYSFFVSSKIKTTLAIGYTQMIEFADFKHYGKNNFFTGTVYNPFFVAAKRWGDNFHTLIYAGPLIYQDFETKVLSVGWQIHTSFLYTIPQTRHFIGVELNKEINHGKLEMTMRPQIKIKLNKQVALGFVKGIPINKSGASSDLFLRVIYEP